MGRTFAEKSNNVFRQIVVIIVAVWGAVAVLGFAIYQKAYLYAGVLLHKAATACGCTQMTQLVAMHPLIFAALAAISLIILTWLFYAAYKLVKLIMQTRKFTAGYLTGAKLQPSAKLKMVMAGLDLDKGRIIEIRELKSVVFCFGLWKPRVCISSGLIKILRPDELAAVLAHEYYHLSAREPAKLFIIKYWQSVFGWLPGIKTCIKKYVTLAELAADEQATDNFSDRSKLARAIFKVSQTEEKHLLRAGLALSFFSSTITERINRLADNTYEPRFKLWGRRFFLGAGLVIFSVLTAFIFLDDSAKALAMHNAADGLNGKPNPGANPVCNLNNYQSRPIWGNRNSYGYQVRDKCGMN